MSDFWVVIPARYASSRLPGKPLLEIGGKPMIQHVWERANESGAGHVLIATDDSRILSACEGFGAEAVMTSDQHQSGTDRIAEAIGQYELDDNTIIVNVQGDEPQMPYANIRQVAELAARPGTDIATLHVPVTSLDEYLNPNVVKCVMGGDDRAIYFSRAPVPWHRDGAAKGIQSQQEFGHACRHLGIYAYRASALRKFSAAEPAALEMTEKLEQLRALVMGMTVRAVEAMEVPLPGIDTPEDLSRLREKFLRG